MAVSYEDTAITYEFDKCEEFCCLLQKLLFLKDFALRRCLDNASVDVR